MKHLRAGVAIIFASLLPLSKSYAQDACGMEGGHFVHEITDKVIDTIKSSRNNASVDKSQSGNNIIRINYPEGSYDPKSMLRLKKPIAGVNLRIAFEKSYDCLYLNYALKFPNEFDFVHGGKLPGLFGGNGNTGGRTPTGYDGFSARFLWLDDGGGAVYAYLPTSKVWGTALGSNAWSYKKGTWHQITQKIQLNSAGQADGVLKVWLDDRLVYSNQEMIYRYDNLLSIDGILFSSFFGGNKPKFASSKDTFAQVKNIVISSHLL